MANEEGTLHRWNDCVVLSHRRWQNTHGGPSGARSSARGAAASQAARERAPATDNTQTAAASPRHPRGSHKERKRPPVLSPRIVIVEPPKRTAAYYHDGIPGTVMTYFSSERAAGWESEAEQVERAKKHAQKLEALRDRRADSSPTKTSPWRAASDR